MNPPNSADGAAQLRLLARRAMVARGLWPEFAPAALQQADSLAQPSPDRGAVAAQSALAGRGESLALRDLRSLPWCSIDNDDSRDLDQLSVAEPLAGGVVKVLIAIADVAALVARSTPIDQHALHNTTSVYTAAQVFSMLPERLSTDLSVLAEGNERAAIIVEFYVQPDGSVGQSDIYAAAVVNKAKLAYDSVAAWLDGRQPAPARVSAVTALAEQLRLQDRVAQALKQLRHEHGALTLQTLELRVMFAEDQPRELRIEQPNRAKELIEEFMIAANAATAHFLERRGFPSVRRVLPPPEHWDRIVALAAAAHETLPAQPDAAALNNFLVKRRSVDPSRFADLSLSIIKLLGRGEYALDLPGQSAAGHFGLAVSDYLHATAPNRRFPDLLTQRLLRAALAGAPLPYTPDELRQIAAHCTEQEDNAAKVERQVAKSAAAMLLAARLGQQFDGIVTGASSKGTWIRISAPPVEGRIVQGYQGLDVGDHAHVRLVHTDIERGFIDFERIQGRP
jgi:VacB/RNase II family 3'-5' exoribonuclease